MSKLGQHVSGPNRDGFKDYLRLPAAANSPVAVVMAVNCNVWNDVHEASPSTLLIYRDDRFGSDPFSDAFFAGTVDQARNAGYSWVSKYAPVWSLNKADYYSIVNEPGVHDAPGYDRYNAFCLGAMTRAYELGLKLALYDWSAGTPDLTLLSHLLPSLVMAKAGGHLLALHEYGLEGGMIVDPPNNTVLRYRKLRALLPVEARCDFIITEAGPGAGYDCGLVMQPFVDDVAKYDTQVMQDAYVKGVALFGLGNTESNMQPVLPLMAAYIAKTPTPVVLPPPPPPPVEQRGKPREQYARVVEVVPQNTTLTRYLEICAQAFPDKRTIGFSYDDGGIGDLADRTVRLWDLPLDQQPEYLDWFNKWYPGVKVEFWPKRITSALPVPYLSQLGVNADFAPGDCGAACLAMMLNYRGRHVTVDQVSRATGKPSGFTTLSAGNLQDASASFGLPLIHTTVQTLVAVSNEITARLPVMALVNYAVLPERVKHDPAYTRAHWILVVGVTPQTIIYHDPYELSFLQGANKEITHLEFYTAWSTVPQNGDFTIPRQLLHIGQSTPAPSVIYAYSGVGQGNPSRLSTAEFNTFKTSRLSAIKLLTTGDSGDNAVNVMAIKANNAQAFIMARLFFSVNPPGKFTPAEFVDYCHVGLDTLYSAGVRYFEVHNEPNLCSEGLGFNWPDGTGFAQWLIGVLNILRLRYPDGKWGFPGMSPGGSIAGVRQDSNAFLSQAAAGIAACDWIGAHSYWDDNLYPMLSATGGLSFRSVRDKAQGKPVFVTEFSNNSPTVSATAKGIEYVQYYAALKAEPGVLGAFAFALSWPGSDERHEGWLENPGIAQAVGAS